MGGIAVQRSADVRRFGGRPHCFVLGSSRAESEVGGLGCDVRTLTILDFLDFRFGLGSTWTTLWSLTSAAANPAIASRLQSLRPVRRVAELGSFGVSMTASVTITLSIPPADKHRQQMRRAAQALTDVETSIEVFQSPENPKRLTARFSVPDARQADVVDRIGRELWRWIEDYNDSSVGFGPKKRRTSSGSSQ
jgi:hypothetical protein